MPVLSRKEHQRAEPYPGVQRWLLVDGDAGARSLQVGDMTIGPGARVSTHVHNNTEEAMVILEGELEAVLGDQVATVRAGDTVLAPPGVKHGFVNRSATPARLMFVFPTTTVHRELVE